MKLSDYQKKFLTTEIRYGIEEIKDKIKLRKKQLKEKEINWSESTFTYIINKKKEDIKDLKELANYFNLDINKY